MLISESSTVNESLLSIILVSGGLVTLVVTVLGIKLRWFRHRLTFEEPIESSQGSSFEIRESCSRGLYRQTLDVEVLESLSGPVVKQQSPQTNNRESIFRWPFRSKLQLTHKLFKEEQGTISTLQSVATSSHEHEYNVERREKNEKLKKMISERISLENTANQQYREVSVDREPVAEAPVALKRKSLEVLTPPVVAPRTIIKIEAKEEVAEIVKEALAEIPKEEVAEVIDTPDTIEATPILSQKLPKSILKNSETNTNTKTIKFQEVVVMSSSESESEDSSDFSDEDPWNLVDQHRNALNRKEKNSSPPPLPKSSPPSLDMEKSNNYSFA